MARRSITSKTFLTGVALVALAGVGSGCKGCENAARETAWQARLVVSTTCDRSHPCMLNPAKCKYGGPYCVQRDPFQKGICVCATEEEAAYRKWVHDLDEMWAIGHGCKRTVDGGWEPPETDGGAP